MTTPSLVVSVPREPTESPLDRALAFIESLTEEPLLDFNDRLMEVDDIREHAMIELASIRKQIADEVTTVVWNGQDYINAIKAHKAEHGSNLAVARDAVDQGWRPVPPHEEGAVAWLYTENRWKDGPRHRLSMERQAISDEDLNEFEITETALYAHPAQQSSDVSGLVEKD